MEYTECSFPVGLSGQYFLNVKGIFYSQSECLENNRIQVIQCNNIDKWMKVKIKEIDKEEWTEINMDGLKHGVTVDLSDRGDRWEGDSLNGQPYGFGNFYDENNHIIYSGFIYNGKKVCWGSEFFIDNSVVKYTGCYYRNKRYGYGKSYDKKATCTYKGEWIGDQPIQFSTVSLEKGLQEDIINIGIEKLQIDHEYKSSFTSFQLHDYSHLQILVIGQNCFRNIKSFSIDNCKLLKNVKISDYSFTRQSSIKTKNHELQFFNISNCKELKNVSIGKYSFSEFAGSCILKSDIILIVFYVLDLPSLTHIRFSGHNFIWIDHFTLDSRILYVFSVI